MFKSPQTTIKTALFQSFYAKILSSKGFLKWERFSAYITSKIIHLNFRFYVRLNY